MGSLCVLDRLPRTLSTVEGKLLRQLALVAQDLLALQAASATDEALPPALQARLDALLHQSLTRLGTLAALRGWHDAMVPGEVDRYTEARLDEAGYLAQSLHRELHAALTVA